MEAAELQLDFGAAPTKTRNQENFPVGVLIAARLRPHVHAFYDFARAGDDIADDPSLPPGVKIARLDAMAAQLTGGGRDPIASRLRESLAVTGVTPQHSLQLLAAFRQDAVKSRYASWEELLDYCRLSAMPVGRHVLDLHGESEATWPASDALCASLQILNHLQDGAKDLAALDRCYLPLDMLRERGAEVDDLRRVAASPSLRQVLDRLLDLCGALNNTGLDLPRHVTDRRLRLETAMIVGLAQRLTRRLRHGDPVAARVKLHPLDVLGAAIGALRTL